MFAGLLSFPNFVNARVEPKYDNTLFIVQYAIPLLVFTGTRLKCSGFVVIIFMVSWLPYQIYHILSDFFMKNALVGVYTYLVFYFLAMTASAVNPIVYFCFNHRFRLGFKYVFRFLPFVNFANCDHNEMFGDLSRSAMLSVRMRQVQGPYARLAAPSEILVAHAQPPPLADLRHQRV
ncbi:G-PROTEIN-RECEP-F1-2 domain-containing protein [Aphelenchoides fujianensis]|nr:G-PROTEIN-RECEP-F1-2 domain-containing protein [Aphelenchoides fujianensis]